MRTRLPVPKSKLKRPSQIDAHESGRTVYEGSISAMNGLILNERQKAEVMHQLKKGPHFPSQLTATGLSPYDAHHGEAIRRFISQLSDAGVAELQRDAKGRSEGWVIRTED